MAGSTSATRISNNDEEAPVMARVQSHLQRTQQGLHSLNEHISREVTPDGGCTFVVDVGYFLMSIMICGNL